MMLTGIPASPGFALGKALLYQTPEYHSSELCFSGDAEPQWARLLAALQAADRELEALAARLSEEGGAHGAIFKAHREILADEEILALVEDGVYAKRQTPERAVQEVFDLFAATLQQASDPLIAERAADLRDVKQRILRCLSGSPATDITALHEPVVLVAAALLPSDTARLDHTRVLGIVTETGSATSHIAILANGFGIPAVLGVKDATACIQSGLPVGLDAQAGIVLVAPDETEKAALQQKRAAWEASKKAAMAGALAPAVTLDGTAIEVGLNISSAEATAAYAFADYIGLFRTEFLFMRGDRAPNEAEQLAAYRQVLEEAEKTVVLRTVDIGGDKAIGYLQLPLEDNPFLGVRGLRLCFAQEDLFRTQLRAALRASLYGRLWLMLPMVGSIDDIRLGRAVFDDVKSQLRAEGIPFDEQVKFGIMVEIPAIATIADLAAREVDFASIGTNDLAQYLCAADRMNPQVAAYCQTYSPAMVRTLAHILAAFHALDKPVSVCGEMAGDTLGAALLIGLGFRKFSMSEGKIAGVKQAIARFDAAVLQQAADRTASLCTEQEVIDLMKEASGI